MAAVTYFDKLIHLSSGKSEKEVRRTWQLWAKAMTLLLLFVLIRWFCLKLIFITFSVAIMLITYGGPLFTLKTGAGRARSDGWITQAPYKTALYIGLFQVSVTFPRDQSSGTTIVGIWSMELAVLIVTEFTFYLGTAMFGASLAGVAKFVLGGNV